MGLGHAVLSMCPSQLGFHLSSLDDTAVLALLVQLNPGLDDVHRLEQACLCYATQGARETLDQGAQLGLVR